MRRSERSNLHETFRGHPKTLCRQQITVFLNIPSRHVGPEGLFPPYCSRNCASSLDAGHGKKSPDQRSRSSSTVAASALAPSLPFFLLTNVCYVLGGGRRLLFPQSVEGINPSDPRAKVPLEVTRGGLVPDWGGVRRGRVTKRVDGRDTIGLQHVLLRLAQVRRECRDEIKPFPFPIKAKRCKH